MIPLIIKIEGKTTRVTSPASWRELNLGQLIDIETKWDKKNPIQLFSIVTGIDYKILAGSKDKNLEDKMMAICAFAYEQPQWDNLSKPNLIDIGDGVYKTPNNIDRKMLGQKVMVNQIAIKEGADLIKYIPNIIAVYMQPIVDGKYNDERLEEIEGILLKSSAMECFALARFFFQQSQLSMSIGQSNLKKSPSPQIQIDRLLNGLERLKGSINLMT